jgi:phosphoribosyl 1,2-cyclic phosphate phosphodiesterase
LGDTFRFTVLGCGSSPGVPRIGGDWGACDPGNAKNRRRRCSLLAQRISRSGRTTNVLVDTSPDLREQALSVGLAWLDGVLYTHSHADHIHGIDDLRGFVMAMQRRIDLYADMQTRQRLREAFGYCFETPPGSEYPPIADLHTIEPGVPLAIEGEGGALTALPVTQLHGRITSLAFRFGRFAYSPDVSGFDAEAERQLAGLDVWIVDALRPRPHPSHLSLSQALDWIERIKPKRAILTHMHVDLDYETLRRELPENVEPAYDGMVIELPE